MSNTTDTPFNPGDAVVLRTRMRHEERFDMVRISWVERTQHEVHGAGWRFGYEYIRSTDGYWGVSTLWDTPRAYGLQEVAPF